MAKDRDGQRNQDEFSLEAILAEFGSGSGERQGEPPAAPSDARTEESATGRDGPPDAPQRDELAEQDWFPTSPRTPGPEDGEDHAAVSRLSLLPGPIPAGSALFGLIFYDNSDHSLCLHPYSIVTPAGILRLQY